MVADVGLGVRPAGRAQEGHAHVLSVNGPAVGRSREQGDAEAVLGEVGEAMAGDLVLGEVAARRVVGRALDDAELHLVGRTGRVDGDREADLQRAAVLVPVDLAVELEARRLRVEAHGLPHAAARGRSGARRRPRRAGGRRGRPRRTRPAGSRCGSRGGTGRGPRPRRPSAGPRRARGRCRGRPWPRARSPSRRGSAARRRGRGPRAGARSRARTRRRPRVTRTSEPASTNRPDAARRRLREAQAVARRHDLAAPDADGVDHLADEEAVAHRAGRGLDLGQVALGALVDLADRGAREDVVEVVEQERLPRAIELLARPRLIRRRPRAARRRAAPAPRAGSPAWCAPASCTSRGGTRGRARRRPRATAPRRPARAKNASGSPMVVRGTSCRSSTRASVSSICAVGPPPPSPQPKTSRLRADSAWSLKSRAARRSSGTVASAL